MSPNDQKTSSALRRTNDQKDPDMKAAGVGALVGATGGAGYALATGALPAYWAAQSAQLASFSLLTPIAGSVAAPVFIPVAIGVAVGGVVGFAIYSAWDYFSSSENDSQVPRPHST